MAVISTGSVPKATWPGLGGGGPSPSRQRTMPASEFGLASRISQNTRKGQVAAPPLVAPDPLVGKSLRQQVRHVVGGDEAFHNDGGCAYHNDGGCAHM